MDLTVVHRSVARQLHFLGSRVGATRRRTQTCTSMRTRCSRSQPFHDHAAFFGIFISTSSLCTTQWTKRLKCLTLPPRVHAICKFGQERSTALRDGGVTSAPWPATEGNASKGSAAGHFTLGPLLNVRGLAGKDTDRCDHTKEKVAADGASAITCRANLVRATARRAPSFFPRLDCSTRSRVTSSLSSCPS